MLFLFLTSIKFHDLSHSISGTNLYYQKEVLIMELTSTEFARAIRVSLTTVYNLESKGIVLPVRKSPFGRRFYTHEQAEVYLAGDYDNPILKGNQSNGVSDTEEV